jgi:hypothetical protein
MIIHGDDVSQLHIVAAKLFGIAGSICFMQRSIEPTEAARRIASTDWTGLVANLIQAPHSVGRLGGAISLKTR